MNLRASASPSEARVGLADSAIILDNGWRSFDDGLIAVEVKKVLVAGKWMRDGKGDVGGKWEVVGFPGLRGQGLLLLLVEVRAQGLLPLPLELGVQALLHLLVLKAPTRPLLLLKPRQRGSARPPNLLQLMVVQPFRVLDLSGLLLQTDSTIFGITAKEGTKIVNIEDGKNRRYALVEEIVRKALRVLESAEGIDSLAKMTEALLKYWEGAKPPKPTTWGNRAREMANMKKEMAAFVQRLRTNFPLIRLETAREGDAYTERFEPIGGADVVDFAKFDMERVELILPSDVSTTGFVLLFLPICSESSNRALANMVEKFQQLIANIMKAEDTQLPITNCMFHMILTVCHEVIHMLVCAISGERRPLTPQEMEVEGHEPLVGESGWWWEINYLGGVVKMFQNKTDPAAAVLPTRQSGLPLLASGTSKKSTFRRIDPAYIATFVQDSIRNSSLSPFGLNMNARVYIHTHTHTTANNYYQ